MLGRLDRLEERLDEQGKQLQKKEERINNLEDVVAQQAMMMAGTCSMVEGLVGEVRGNHRRTSARINLLKATDDYLLYLTDDVANYIHLKPGDNTVASKEGIVVAFRLAQEADAER